ncbi:Aim18p [Sugiyamaella lignohabitans]|uniref:Altered inheritance of mitochondria protein 18, mitochondrial n=1 Tax=Sugiyamaella lignohabitans TaxID=796027 RepID=A0A167DH85_9ASCO|nr:Aim18p [Sugiyamaella lignohabitans]ANB12915.1 Aim18p [Sugiyamaella lignohabitans]
MFRQSGRLATTTLRTRIGAGSRSFTSTATAQLRSRAVFGTTILSGVLVAYTGLQLLDPGMVNPIRLDSPPGKLTSETTVQPDTKVAFPNSISIDKDEFQLLGSGVRSVSFFFQVYAVGIYIAKDDINKVKQVLSSSVSADPAQIQAALLDDVRSGELISKLLAAGTRLSIRIVPVRKTDFGHLRDGFVRAIVGHPRFKQLPADNGGEGIGDLKKAFGRKRSVLKGQILYLNRSTDGKLSIEFYADTKESPDAHEVLGVVDEPLISELLFLKYLSGKNPSSESARQTSVDELSQLVAVH